jgi:hypothetical protein
MLICSKPDHAADTRIAVGGEYFENVVEEFGFEADVIIDEGNKSTRCRIYSNVTLDGGAALTADISDSERELVLKFRENKLRSIVVIGSSVYEYHFSRQHSLKRDVLQQAAYLERAPKGGCDDR